MLENSYKTLDSRFLLWYALFVTSSASEGLYINRWYNNILFSWLLYLFCTLCKSYWSSKSISIEFMNYCTRNMNLTAICEKSLKLLISPIPSSSFSHLIPLHPPKSVHILSPQKIKNLTRFPDILFTVLFCKSNSCTNTIKY